MSGTRIASVSGVRGIVGDGLDPEIVCRFVAAYASSCDDGPIVVGHDGRVSAPVFEPILCAALQAAGRGVLRAGPVATPTLGRLVVDKGAAGGIQLSASHNPPSYNGLKFFQRRGMVLDASQGRAVLDRVESGSIDWADWRSLGGLIPIDDPDAGHLERILSLVDVEAIARRRFRVALNAAHGSGGRLGHRLLSRLGCQVDLDGGVPDGRYEHPPEPTEENLRAWSERVGRMGADVGFAQDPDADRLAIVDQNGRYIGEEKTLALAAWRVWDERPGPLAINLSTSWLTERMAAQRPGCSVVRSPVGEIHVVGAIQEAQAVLGGEGNGGVIDPRVGFVRDSFVGMALVLDLLARTGEPLGQLVDRLPEAVMVKRKAPLVGGRERLAAVLERVAGSAPEARVDRRDGVRLDWPDQIGWVHLRGSNTEPIVRIIAESTTADRAGALADRVATLLEEGNGAGGLGR